MSIAEFVEHMNKHRLFLYHFTDSRNLESIRAHGIVSLEAIERDGINVRAFGGNRISRDQDKRLGYHRYVHLSLTSSHPMGHAAKKNGQIINLRTLRIMPRALLTEGTLFSDRVCNKNGAIIGGWEVAKELYDWTALYGRLDWKKKDELKRRQAAEKYEILIPDRIDIGDIIF